MTFIHKGHRLLINDLSIQEYGKSVEQMLKEQLIVNMHQNLHINTQTIATICNIPLELVQQVLTQKGLI
ncbi:MAG: hypothetical protein IPN94_07615 [Sphingobacteriales bacterium]|nr:hypothetical protein [Sphingobacteriales bacterium]